MFGSFSKVGEARTKVRFDAGRPTVRRASCTASACSVNQPDVDLGPAARRRKDSSDPLPGVRDNQYRFHARRLGSVQCIGRIGLGCRRNRRDRLGASNDCMVKEHQWTPGDVRRARVRSAGYSTRGRAPRRSESGGAYNDKASMAASTEVRVPFLDRQLAEFMATQVPPDMKLRGTTRPTTKYLPRQAMKGRNRSGFSA